MSAPLSQHLDNTDTLADPVPALGMPGLLVMDVDSTLIDEGVIDALGEEVGVHHETAAITARAMNGELDFRQALD
ncbi:phosphoserine phosphatase SerB, partial [Bifidobacterium breve]|nr:phosphoserine phosphatase SerB [Bifidobacterium breve]